MYKTNPSVFKLYRFQYRQMWTWTCQWLDSQSQGDIRYLGLRICVLMYLRTYVLAHVAWRQTQNGVLGQDAHHDMGQDAQWASCPNVLFFSVVLYWVSYRNVTLPLCSRPPTDIKICTVSLYALYWVWCTEVISIHDSIVLCACGNMVWIAITGAPWVPPGD